jgi:hypothetical protein
VIRRLLPAAVAAVLLLGPVATRTPASEVRSKLVEAAKELALLIKGEQKNKDKNQVAIKEFTGPALPRTSAGPMIQTILVEELTKLKVAVEDGAFLFVGGEYFVLEDEQGRTEDLTVRLVITLRNKSGAKVGEVNKDIGYKGNEDLVKLLAINANLEKVPRADRERQNQYLRQQYNHQVPQGKKPRKGHLPLKLASTKIKVSPDSPYAVEVLTRPAGGDDHQLRIRTPRAEKGQAYVQIRRGEEYVLRLSNHSKHEAAVSITIDGVDAFQFFDGRRRPSTYLVGPGKTRLVKGWMRSTEEVNAFLVGSFAKSAAASVLKGSAQIGTITVCFHPCWEGQKPPPGYEGSRDVRPNATGLGRRIGENTQVTRRTIGPLAAAVSIRYNK